MDGEWCEDMLTHLSLFTGIGGIDFAAEWAGFTTVGQCEMADYPTKVLEKHWPDVTRWRDVRDVTAESFREQTGLSTVDLISGGFPCQPFSVAGDRRGTEDDRYLWPEMQRVIEEIRPTWVIAENVIGLVSMEQSDALVVMEDEATICKEAEMVLETIRRGLANIGYDSKPIAIPVAGVGGLHLRYRLFILAHPTSIRRTKMVLHNISSDGSGPFKRWPSDDAGTLGCERDWTDWETQSGIQLVVDGVPDGLARHRAIGNAVSPQQVYPILKAIADIEGGIANDQACERLSSR